MSDEPNKPLDQALDKIGAEWAAESAGGDEFVRRFRARMAAGEGATMQSIAPAPRRRLRPLLLAAAVVIALAGITWMLTPNAPAAGTLRFATGTVSGPAELASGSRVETGADGAAIAMLDGERIALHLNANAVMTVQGRDAVELSSGELWAVIVPNSGHFEVQTPQARVVAKGTTFGVVVGPDGTHVFLESGRVEVESATARATLEPGGRATIGNDHQQPAVQPGSPLAEAPAWVQALTLRHAEEQAARTYPSGVPGGRKP